MSRFAIDPRWLVYLPPTMSPPATSERDRSARAPGGGVRGLPARRRRPASCARRSTWARAPSSSCAATPRSRARRFGVDDSAAAGVDLHAHRPRVLRRRRRSRPALLDRVRAAFDRDRTCGTSSTTDWVVLDCELLPWSAKAEELLRTQYASVGAAATATLDAEAAVLDAGRGAARRRASRSRPEPPTRRDDGRALRRRVPALLLAGRRRSTTSRSRRSRCSPPKARVRALDASPVAHRRRSLVSPTPIPGLLRATRAHRGRPRRPRERGRRRSRGGRSSPPAGARAWSSSRATSSRATARAARAAGHQVPRPRVPAHHLRPRVHRARRSSTRLRERGLGHKRSLAIREFALGIEALERFVAQRAAVPRPRVRLRRPRARERAGRPPALIWRL